MTRLSHDIPPHAVASAEVIDGGADGLVLLLGVGFDRIVDLIGLVDADVTEAFAMQDFLLDEEFPLFDFVEAVEYQVSKVWKLHAGHQLCGH